MSLYIVFNYGDSLLIKKYFVSTRHALFFIRGLTLLARFIFIIFIANQLSVIEVGFYGFITASIFAAVYMIGYEHGNFSARQIIKCKTLSCQEKSVSSLSIFGLIMFVLISPIVFYATASNDIYKYISIPYFFIIAYGESYIAEHKKVLISLGHPFYTGMVDFVKSGVWVYLLIPLVISGWLDINLNIILLVWLIFVSIGASLIFFKLRSFYKIENLIRKPKFNKYKNQIYSSSPFFLSGLSLLAIEISGRVSLQMAGLQIEAGVYTFYTGFIFAIPLFVWSASVSLDHEKILTAFEHHDIKKSNKLILIMIKRSLKICFLLSVILFFGFGTLLEMVDKNEYVEHINSFYLFLIVPFIHILDSHIYYLLYVRGMDKEIAASSFIGFVCLAIFQIFTVYNFGIFSVVLSIIIALVFSVFIKLFFIFKNSSIELKSSII
jgi:O-antigen/teichoic acid export membrane protein